MALKCKKQSPHIFLQLDRQWWKTHVIVQHGIGSLKTKLSDWESNIIILILTPFFFFFVLQSKFYLGDRGNNLDGA